MQFFNFKVPLRVELFIRCFHVFKLSYFLLRLIQLVRLIYFKVIFVTLKLLFRLFLLKQLILQQLFLQLLILQQLFLKQLVLKQLFLQQLFLRQLFLQQLFLQLLILQQLFLKQLVLRQLAVIHQVVLGDFVNLILNYFELQE